jgi:hypothetical protein
VRSWTNIEGRGGGVEEGLSKHCKETKVGNKHTLQEPYRVQALEGKKRTFVYPDPTPDPHSDLHIFIVYFLEIFTDIR